MIQTVIPLFLHCKTPFHPGSGSDLGIVDLPVQRESHTGYPKFEASGLKGCLRESYAKGTDEELIFGPAEKGDDHGGSVCLTDARALLFPVRSFRGVFAYITCPYAMERFLEELKVAKLELSSLATGPDDNCALVCTSSVLWADKEKKGEIALEEYTFGAKETPELTAFAEALGPLLGEKLISGENLKKRLAVLSDDDFAFFVKTATETVTRVRIDQKTGTVASGALFTEEYIPAETLFYSLAMAGSILLKDADKQTWKENHPDITDESKYLLDLLKRNTPSIVQMGGDATIGKGLVAVHFGEVK